MDYGLSLAVIQVYDLYVDACKGLLDESWAINENKIYPLASFVTKLSKRMMEYDPLNQAYGGDGKKQDVTHSNKKYQQQRKQKHDATNLESFVGRVSREQFLRELVKEDSRLCRDVTALNKHYQTGVKVNNGSPCEVYGIKSWTRCGICEILVRAFPYQGKAKGKASFIEAHDPNMFGLCRSDSKLIGTSHQEFTPTLNNVSSKIPSL